MVPCRVSEGVPGGGARPLIQSLSDAFLQRTILTPPRSLVVTLKVGSGGEERDGAILEETNASVAWAAQKAPHRACVVVMIDMRTLLA